MLLFIQETMSPPQRLSTDPSSTSPSSNSEEENSEGRVPAVQRKEQLIGQDKSDGFKETMGKEVHLRFCCLINQYVEGNM